MRISKYARKVLLVSMMIGMILASTVAYGLVDPFNTGDYPNQNQGKDYNYGYDKETGLGELSASVGYTIKNAKTAYKPGDVVEIEMTIASIPGKGDDGIDKDGIGTNGIEDVMLYITDDNKSKVYQYPEYSGTLVDSQQGDILLDIKEGESANTTFTYTIPANATGTVFLNYELYDYGMFLVSSDEFPYSEGKWVHALTQSGKIPFPIVKNYGVSAITNPAGVRANFQGTGSTFVTGDAYLVSLSSYDSSNWIFTGWSTTTSGIIASSDVVLVANFTSMITPPPTQTYTVGASSNPSGVATFIGTGSGFSTGQAYNVAYTIVDPTYVFTGWSQSPIGNIANSNVNLIANFEKKVVKTYKISATTEPANVATFTGTGEGFSDGTSYDVTYSNVNPGYTFVEWKGLPTGTIVGADVSLVAVFVANIEEVKTPEAAPNEGSIIIETSILDENLAQGSSSLPATGGIPLAGFAFVGFVITAVGAKLRKK